MNVVSDLEFRIKSWTKGSSVAVTGSGVKKKDTRRIVRG
jgi:hypothetical protein